MNILLKIDYSDLSYYEEERMLVALEDDDSYILYTDTPLEPLAEGIHIDNLARWCSDNGFNHVHVQYCNGIDKVYQATDN